MAKQNVTLKDIAQAVNLSINSVSKALKDSSEISLATRQKVKEVAKAMNYVPNVMASSLRGGETKLIAIVFDDLTNPYFGILGARMQSHSHEIGYDLMIIITDEYILNLECIKKICARQVDAVISFMEPNDESIDYIKSNRVPFLILGKKANNWDVDIISTNDYEGGYKAAEVLINAGCNNIGYIGPDVLGNNIGRRFDGFKKCLQDKGVKINEKNFISFDFSESITSEIVNHINESFDGVFCFNDMLAYDLLSSGVKKYVVGFDDLQSTLFSSKYLTTITSNLDTMAKKIIDMTVERIKDYDMPRRDYEFEVSVTYGKTCPKA